MKMLSFVVMGLALSLVTADFLAKRAANNVASIFFGPEEAAKDSSAAQFRPPVVDFSQSYEISAGEFIRRHQATKDDSGLWDGLFQDPFQPNPESFEIRFMTEEWLKDKEEDSEPSVPRERSEDLDFLPTWERIEPILLV